MHEANSIEQVRFGPPHEVGEQSVRHEGQVVLTISNQKSLPVIKELHPMFKGEFYGLHDLYFETYQSVLNYLYLFPNIQQKKKKNKHGNSRRAYQQAKSNTSKPPTPIITSTFSGQHYHVGLRETVTITGTGFNDLKGAVYFKNANAAFLDDFFVQIADEVFNGVTQKLSFH